MFVNAASVMPVSSMTPRCPRCRSSLTLRRRIGWGVGWCARCEGVWLDSAALREVERRAGGRSLLLEAVEARGRAAAAGHRVPLPCAACGEPMAPRRIGRTLRLVVESCDDHGVWVDGDDLLQLAAFIQEGNAELSCPPEHEHRVLAEAFEPVFELLGCG